MSLGNHSNQSSQDPCEFFKEFQWRQTFLTREVHFNLGMTIAINILAWPFTVLINAMVVYIVFSSPLVRSVPSNLVVAFMSVTDCATAAIAQPLFIASASCRITGRCNSCLLDLARNIALTLFCTSSAFHLVLMAIERLIAIKYPLRYISLVTTRKIILAVVLGWTLATFQAITLFISTDRSLVVDIGRVVVVLCVVAAIFTIFCYLIIYFESRRHQKAIKAQMQLHSQKAQKIEFKAAKTTFLITCAVGVTYFINGVVNAVAGALFRQDRTNSSASLFFNIECWSLTLVLLNSLFNPLIYTVRCEKIASGIRKLLHLQTIRVTPLRAERREREVTAFPAATFS